MSVDTIPVKAGEGTRAETEETPQSRHWVGLRAYRDTKADAQRFRGRTEETAAFERRLRRGRVTVLFGATGVGKTSLLRAGLFPSQRQKDALPVHVRLDCSSEAQPLASQVQTSIITAARAARMRRPPDSAESLWEYLHQDGGEFWTRHHTIAMPLIVLDQFEELFTLGQQERPKDCDAFVSELSDLAEERVPLKLRERLAGRPEEAERLRLNWHHYRIVVSIDEAFLGRLDKYARQHALGMFDNRWRLEGLTRDEDPSKDRALQVAMGPTEVPWIADQALAEQIVSKATSVDQEGVPRADPALLSVILWQLDRRRGDQGEIRADLVEEFGKGGLLGFYESGLDTLPARNGGTWGRLLWPRARRAHDYIEAFLVRGDRRDSRPLADVRRELGPDVLGALEDRGVLGLDRRRAPPRVELAHEVLVGPVREYGRRSWRVVEWTLLLFLLVASSWAVIATGLLVWEAGSDARDLRAADRLSAVLDNVVTNLNVVVDSASDSLSVRNALAAANDSLGLSIIEQRCEAPGPLIVFVCRNVEELRVQAALGQERLSSLRAGVPYPTDQQWLDGWDIISVRMEENIRAFRAASDALADTTPPQEGS